jgi:protein-tyrosine phosphatase
VIDIHVHILAGVDDGPGNLTEAVEMCRLAREGGTTTMLVTPHQRHPLWANNDDHALRESLLATQQAVGSSPELVLGAEIRVDADLLAEVERIPANGLLPLAASHYLLLEFAEATTCTDARLLVHELVVSGWRPIVAHPERIAPWAEAPASLAELVRAGALLQLTGMSVTGEFGRRAQACCRSLLDDDLVHFVASDGHDARKRPPSLARAHRQVAEQWGEERAERLMVANPTAVLEDRPLTSRS